MNSIKIFSLICCCFLLIACSRVPLASEPAIPSARFSNNTQVITSQNAVKLAEVKRLSKDEPGPVAVMKFSTNEPTLLVAYAEEDAVREWSLVDDSIKRMILIYPVTTGGVAFDASGRLIATGAGTEWVLHKDDDSFLGVRVWDIRTGNLVRRVGEKYDTQSKALTSNFASKVLLSPDGNWIMMIDTTVDPDLKDLKNLTIYEVNSGRIGDLGVDLSRKLGDNSFDVITFDATGEYFAAADHLGKVAVFPFQPPSYPKTGEVIIEQTGSSESKTLALAFDPRRHWLAAMRGMSLVVWNLQSPNYERQIDVVVADQESSKADLAFDPTGRLLSVSTIDGWQIWDVETKELLLKYPGIGNPTVAFSPDGRLFVWGDTSGVVHVWGVSDP